MRVELNVPEPVREPRMWVKDQAVLAMALRPGSFELGLRRSEMTRLTYDAGEMSLVPRHFEKWFRTDDLHYLSVGRHDLLVIPDQVLQQLRNSTQLKPNLEKCFPFTKMPGIFSGLKWCRTEFFQHAHATRWGINSEGKCFVSHSASDMSRRGNW